MMYLRVEMWPKGDRSKAYLLGEATIENVGGTATQANYDVRFSKRSGFSLKKADQAEPRAELLRVLRPLASSVWKSTRIEGFPRVARGVWDLLYRALVNTVGTRNLVGVQDTHEDIPDPDVAGPADE